jgi:ribose-phosphate pyrophosphokinase
MADDAPEQPLAFALSPYRRLVASISGVERGDAAVDRFPNRELHARIAAPVRGRDCIVVGSISPPDTRLAQLTLLAHTLRRGDARSITAMVPYLAYARQDRADVGESLGLAWVGVLLAAAGVDAVVTVDVHSRAAPALLGMPVISLPGTPVLAAALPPEWTSSDVTFVAPDEGARERCQALADAVASARPIAVVAKRRSATGVVHTELTGTVGRRVVLVDDILDTGATLISCCRWLAREGVEDVAVVVTHGVLTGDAWRALPSVGVRRLWMTDTVPSAGRRAASADIVPIAPVLAPRLRGST